MKLKAQYLPVIVLLLTLAGCKKKNKKAAEVAPKKNKIASLAIPLAQDNVVVGEDESVRSFFDNDSNQFVAQDDKGQEKPELIPNDAKDFAPANVAQDKSFEKLYFGFDKHDISKDQAPVVAKNAASAKKIVAEAAAKGQDAKLNLEGHADTFAGSSAYNVALSEKRAVAEKNALVAQGVPAENITVVGRGNEIPAIVDGKPVVGDKDQQWPNRRVEARVIYN
jgi:outer membrane protein OmpA-like peptidoglycan-associated protein